MFAYLKNVIAANTTERVSAFLAVISGISLCFGFLSIIGFILFSTKNLNYPLVTITAGLVTLATFSKVDRTEPAKPDKTETTEG